MAPPNLSPLAEFFFSPRSSDLSTVGREFLGYFVKQFWPGVRTQIDKLPGTRLDYPLLVFPFSLLAFLALLAFWEQPRPRNAVWAGVLAGLLAYVYFHTWVYWTVGLGFLTVATLLWYRQDRARLRGMMLLLASMALVLVPYAWNYYRLITAPGHEDFIRRLSLAEGREFFFVGLGFDYLTYALLSALVLGLFWKRGREKAILFLAFLAAMVGVWNVQLITGFVPAPDHWPKAVSPMLFIVGTAIAGELARLAARRWIWLARAVPLILALAIVGMVTKQVVNVTSLSRGLQPWVAGKYAFPKELVDSWEWMNANLPLEPRVISSSFMTSQYLAVYTSARPYLPQSIISPLPVSDFESRYLAASRLFGVSAEVLGAALTSRPPSTPCTGPSCYYRDENFGKLTDDLYACYFSRGGVNSYFRQGCGVVPEERRAELLAEYARLDVSWDDVPADYVYYGPWERQFSQPHFERDLRLTLVYQNPLVEIYQVKK